LDNFATLKTSFDLSFVSQNVLQTITKLVTHSVAYSPWYYF